MTTATPSTAAKASSKSRLVTLKLSPASLKKFPSDVRDASTPSKESSSSTPTIQPSLPKAEPTESAAPFDTNGTPVPQLPTASSMLAPPPNPVRRKGIPGPKPGMKRNNSQLNLNGEPKPRGKPGPKKKIRLGETPGTNGVAAPAAPKLGPKANQGAINEKLRALDRSGKPCRKWQKGGFQLKSFTGVVWGVPTWAAPRKPADTEFAGDVKSDSSSLGEAKDAPENSANPSDKNSSGPDAGTPLEPGVNGVNSPAALVDTPAA